LSAKNEWLSLSAFGFGRYLRATLMTTSTLFVAFWDGMSNEARQAWIKRRILALVKLLGRTFWSRSLLEDADDIVMTTVERLLMDASGEYAPRGEATAEEYFRRCLFVRVKAVDRMARAQKRQYLGPNHVALDDLNGDTPATEETPESALAGREALETAQETIDKAVANSRLRGFPRLYAERFVEFAAQGLGTADIAKRFNTSEANVRSARSRLMQFLVREGVIAENVIRSIAVEGKPQEESLALSGPPQARH
jgi:DNA-directed RNA polymerase specialized sigma24 family protein